MRDGGVMSHRWERATPVALMGWVIDKKSATEWRAPSHETHDPVADDGGTSPPRGEAG